MEIKDQMAASPERVLELSQVLDQMEEEHERILEEAAAPVAVKAGAAALELQVSARSVRDLRKLLELALHELDGVLDAPQAGVSYPGDMAGSLGAYRFELVVGQAAESDKP
nr:hypothetical protein [Pseudomonas sp. CCOS 191]